MKICYSTTGQDSDRVMAHFLERENHPVSRVHIINMLRASIIAILVLLSSFYFWQPDNIIRTQLVEMLLENTLQPLHSVRHVGVVTAY